MSDFNFITKTQPTKANDYKVIEQTYSKEYVLREIEVEKINRLLLNDVILEITDANMVIYQREVRENVVTTVRHLSFDEIALLKKDKPTKSDVGLRSLLIGIAIVAIPFAAVLGSLELKLQQQQQQQQQSHCEWIEGYENGFDVPLCGAELEKARKEGW